MLVFPTKPAGGSSFFNCFYPLHLERFPDHGFFVPLFGGVFIGNGFKTAVPKLSQKGYLWFHFWRFCIQHCKCPTFALRLTSGLPAKLQVGRQAGRPGCFHPAEPRKHELYYKDVLPPLLATNQDLGYISRGIPTEVSLCHFLMPFSLNTVWKMPVPELSKKRPSGILFLTVLHPGLQMGRRYYFCVKPDLQTASQTPGRPAKQAGRAAVILQSLAGTNCTTKMSSHILATTQDLG